MTFSYFLDLFGRMCRGFRNKGLKQVKTEVKMVGVRACGDLVGNCETWKDQCLSGRNGVKGGISFVG